MKNLGQLLEPTFYILSVIFLIAGLVVGYPGGFLYFILVKLLYAVLVSIVIHGWKAKESVLVESEENKWIVNINGIPIIDNTHALKNLHFNSEKEMSRKYFILLLPKLILSVLLLTVTVITLYQQPLAITFDSVIGVLMSLYLTYKTLECYRLFSGLSDGKWHINSYSLGDRIYYSAFVKNRGQYTTFLNKVFS
ncbi:hypothetical protein [Agarivorans sp. QJM3NY_25]|uniref:hypothetical protein n=1 Tax=Agarivorans sp. QJM3NY_25 TaxID=3421430 RepID=UPI003D7D1BC9